MVSNCSQLTNSTGMLKQIKYFIEFPHSVLLLTPFDFKSFEFKQWDWSERNFKGTIQPRINHRFASKFGARTRACCVFFPSFFCFSSAFFLSFAKPMHSNASDTCGESRAGCLRNLSLTGFQFPNGLPRNWIDKAFARPCTYFNTLIKCFLF